MKSLLSVMTLSLGLMSATASQASLIDRNGGEPAAIMLRKRGTI
jgi:hypothetical protein